MNVDSTETRVSIYLVRHGEPDCPHRRRLSSEDWNQWLADYDAAGVSLSSRPGEELVRLASDCRVWSSTLRRSIESARALGVSFDSSPIFREHEQPRFAVPVVRFSTKSWDLIGKASWYFGYARGAESYVVAKQRAAAAALKLKEEASAHGSVMLLGHGFFNLLIAKQLARLGFEATESARFSYWGCRRFTGAR